MTSILLRPSAGSLLGAPAIVAGRSSPPVRWNPPTLLGVNVTLPFSWSEAVHPTQKDIFDAVGISYVRPGMDYMYPNFSTASDTHDPAQFYVSQVRPFPVDRNQIELRVNGMSYAPTRGEILILAAPVTYTFANGSTLVLPAKTPLICTGGSAGTFTGNYPKPTPVTYGTVRFAAGSLMTDNGAQALSDVLLLHRNFYVIEAKIRRPLPAVRERITEWMDQGFYIDLGATGPAWEQVEHDFGRDAALHMRRQEWAYWASVGYDPDKVLISDGPEPLDFSGAGDNRQLWENCRANLAQSYREIRACFPDHTVSLGIPRYTAINAAQWMGPNSWPGDSNSTLRLHCYPRDITGAGGWGTPSAPGTGSFPLDCDDTIALRNYMDWFMALSHAAGVPRVYWQEMGIKMEQPDAQTRYGNFRRELNRQGIFQCLWAASHYFSDGPHTYDVAWKAPGQTSGPFIPIPELTGVFFDE